MLGRPSGVASALQWLSAIAVTAAGCWYLRGALRQGNRMMASAYHSHVGIASAVGFLPCPLTMLILSWAFAHNGLGMGLMLMLVMALGIMATIGLIGSAGIAGQRGFASSLGRWGGYVPTIRGLEVVSALIILAVGVSTLAVL